jgi:hypothetical protein
MLEATATQMRSKVDLCDGLKKVLLVESKQSAATRLRSPRGTSPPPFLKVLPVHQRIASLRVREFDMRPPRLRIIKSASAPMFVAPRVHASETYVARFQRMKESGVPRQLADRAGLASMRRPGAVTRHPAGAPHVHTSLPKLPTRSRQGDIELEMQEAADMLAQVDEVLRSGTLRSITTGLLKGRAAPVVPPRMHVQQASNSNRPTRLGGTGTGRRTHGRMRKKQTSKS